MRCHTAGVTGPAQIDHGPQVEILERTIRDDGRRVAFLLGAGCGASIEVAGQPLVPIISGLTATARSHMSGATGGTLASLDLMLKEDGIGNPTIEDWLSRLRAMAEIVGASEVRGLKADQISELESALTLSIRTQLDVDLPTNGGGFDSLARWAGSGDRSSPVELFSLNYDLLVETAFERAGLPYFDGFVGSVRPFLDLQAIETDTVPPRWARLWKMHGSVDWVVEENHVRREGNPAKRTGAMIHPSHLKYDQSRRMPYYAMQDRLRRYMALPNATLITIGYSFGDEHINELILQGLRSNSSAVTFALMRSDLSKYPDLEAHAINNLNMRVLAKTGTVAAGVASTWDAAGEVGPIAIGTVGDFGVLGDLLDRQVSL